MEYEPSHAHHLSLLFTHPEDGPIQGVCRGQSFLRLSQPGGLPETMQFWVLCEVQGCCGHSGDGYLLSGDGVGACLVLWRLCV